MAGTFSKGSFVCGTLCTFWFLSKHYHKVIQVAAHVIPPPANGEGLCSPAFPYLIITSKGQASQAYARGGGGLLYIIGRMGLLSKYSYTL